VLTALWWMSLICAAAALSVMGALIALRVRKQRRDRTLDWDRSRLHRSLLTYVMFGPAPSDWIADMIRKRPLLAAEVLVDFSDLVVGDENSRLGEALLGMEYDQLLQGRLARAGPDETRLIIEALSRLPSPKTIETLKRLRPRAKPWLRWAYSRALVKLGDAPPLDEILADFTLAGEPAAFLAEALDELCPGVADVAAVCDSPNATSLIRRVAIGVLATRADAAVVPILVMWLADDDARVRAAAAEALGSSPPALVGGIIRVALTDPHPSVRVAATKAAGLIGDAASVLALVRRLGDDVWDVRFAAATALAGLKGVGDDALRIVAEEGRSRAVRRTAALARTKAA
jgi:HEAT repeat protein